MGFNWTRRVTLTMMKLAGQRTIQHGPIKLISTLSSNVMRSILAWNPGPYFNNRVPGAIMLAAAIAETHPKAAARMLGKLVIPTPIKTYGIEPRMPWTKANEEIRTFLMEQGYLGDRWDSDYSSIAAPISRDSLNQVTGKAKIILRHISNVALNPMMHAETRNGIDAFKALRAEGVTDIEAREIVAKATRATQNSSSPLDDSEFIQGIRDFGLGGLFPFLSQNVTSRNFLISNVIDKDKPGTALAVVGLAASIGATVMFHTLMRSLRGGPDDDKEKSEELALTDAMENVLDTAIPGSGLVFAPLFASYTGLPGNGGMIFEKPLENVARLAGKLVSGKPVDSASVSRMIQSATQLLGLPTGGLFGMARIAKGLATDYEPTTDREKTRRTTVMIHNEIHDAGPMTKETSNNKADQLRRKLRAKGLLKDSASEKEFESRVWKFTKKAAPPQ
jgi:hypothetical protein